MINSSNGRWKIYIWRAVPCPYHLDIPQIEKINNHKSKTYKHTLVGEIYLTFGKSTLPSSISNIIIDLFKGNGLVKLFLELGP